MQAMSSAWTIAVCHGNGFLRGAATALVRTRTCSSCPAPTTVIYPQHAIRHVDRGPSWLGRSAGAASTVRDLPFGVPELQHGQADHERHQDDRLRPGGARVEPDEAILVG